MAMATATESGGCGGGVADALCVGECERFVGWFPDDGVQSGEYKSCTNVVRARSLWGDGHGGDRYLLKLVRTAEQWRIGHWGY